MGASKFLSQAWRRSEKSFSAWMREMAIGWRREESVHRLERPTRLDKARRVGYRAKQGFIVARVRVRKGGARKIRPRSGRRPKAMGVLRYTRAKSTQLIGEERASRRFPNLEVLNSYHVWSDGTSHWYEVVMVDPHQGTVRADPHLRRILGT